MFAQIDNIVNKVREDNFLFLAFFYLLILRKVYLEQQIFWFLILCVSQLGSTLQQLLFKQTYFLFFRWLTIAQEQDWNMH